MDEYLQAILGVGASVVVSVLLFLLAYRQTVGARQERVRVANSDVEKILLNRIVSESYKPTLDEVAQILEGKARDHRVKPGALLSSSQVLNTLFTRIMESDFISPGRRSEILKIVSPLLLKAEEAPVGEGGLLLLQTETKLADRPAYVSVAIAMLASVAGAVAALVTFAGDLDNLTLAVVAASFVAGFTLLLMISLALRVREVPEETSRAGGLRSALEFEEEVERILQKAGANPNIDGRQGDVDFTVEVGGKKVLIEVKAWSRRVPLAILRRTIRRLTEAVEKSGADAAILVTKGSVLELPVDSLRDGRIRVMTTRELRNYLVHQGT